jgi:hypothetical protein
MTKSRTKHMQIYLKLQNISGYGALCFQRLLYRLAHKSISNSERPRATYEPRKLERTLGTSSCCTAQHLQSTTTSDAVHYQSLRLKSPILFAQIPSQMPLLGNVWQHRCQEFFNKISSQEIFLHRAGNVCHLLYLNASNLPMSCLVPRLKLVIMCGTIRSL